MLFSHMGYSPFYLAIYPLYLLLTKQENATIDYYIMSTFIGAIFKGSLITGTAKISLWG